jgi:hypothetical protein
MQRASCDGDAVSAGTNTLWAILSWICISLYLVFGFDAPLLKRAAFLERICLNCQFIRSFLSTLVCLALPVIGL